MEGHRHTQFIQFLQTELAVSDEAIAVALKHPEQDIAPLHMILWQYGLVSIEQLSHIFDWLGHQPIVSTY
jgi:hypothetical protein